MSEFTKEGAVERLRELVAARVPFVHQGRTFEGIDCIGALTYAFLYKGDIPSYPDNPINGELETELTRRMGPPLLDVHRLHPLTTTENLQSLDVLSIQYRGPVRHVAICVPHLDQRNCPGAISIVHTDAMVGRVTEHILDAKWLRRVVKVWRL